MKPVYTTPHIAATPQDFGKTVLMPGDPLRAKFIAENFLTDAKLVNNVRGVHGYTGTYGGTRVSVMASGMGIPSIGIYSYELYHFFGVDNIIRVGSAGAIADKVKVRDVILGMGASTNSDYASMFKLPGTFSATASYELLSVAMREAEGMHLSCHVGNLLSSDNFYSDDATAIASWRKMGVLAIEMEAAGLYMNAARAGKRALALCPVSDHISRGEELDAMARQTSFTDMMELSLKTAVAVDHLPPLSARP